MTTVREERATSSSLDEPCVSAVRARYARTLSEKRRRGKATGNEQDSQGGCHGITAPYSR